MQGSHTAWWTNKKWSGIWTDFSVEQILVKSLMSRPFRLWQCRCAEVTDAVSSILLTEKCQKQHKEIFPARVKRDYEDF